MERSEWKMVVLFDESGYILGFSMGFGGYFFRQNVSQIMHALLQKLMIRSMNIQMLRISTLQAIFHLHSQIYAEKNLILNFSFLSYDIGLLLY